MTNREDFETAIRQLCSAAQLLAAEASADERMTAYQLRAFFQLQEARLPTRSNWDTPNALLKDTAHAALTMAGRKEFLAASALLEQARTLLGG